jgi:hypothetical protein
LPTLCMCGGAGCVLCAPVVSLRPAGPPGGLFLSCGIHLGHRQRLPHGEVFPGGGGVVHRLSCGSFWILFWHVQCHVHGRLRGTSAQCLCPCGGSRSEPPTWFAPPPPCTCGCRPVLPGGVRLPIGLDQLDRRPVWGGPVQHRSRHLVHGLCGGHVRLNAWHDLCLLHWAVCGGPVQLGRCPQLHSLPRGGFRERGLHLRGLQRAVSGEGVGCG